MGDDAEDEDKRQNQDDDGVNLEAGRLVGVQPQHGAAAAAGASGSRAARAGIGDLLLLVGGGSSADGSSGTAGGGGEDGRPVLTPVLAGVPAGDDARGEDCG
ncbi:hypothetical protein PG990_001374 [Apiospora arundinis]